MAACSGGQLWVLGDPRQAPSVKAGGIAAEIAARADAETIPAARLTVNRRQVDPDDRHALLFLSSHLSDMVVGHVLMVDDGGWTIH